MEYCPGGDLVPLLGKNDSRTPRICYDILLGLDALHKKGKVHRDLKPENVLFKQNGNAALTDFGISGDRTHRLTQRNIFGKPNQIFGTYAYMPPEQVNRVRGGATVLPTTDIFSFGVLVYQLLTGNLPFGSLESHNDLAEYQKRGKDGQWNRGALQNVKNGQQWMRLIDCCLKPDFRQRCQNVQEVMKDLPIQEHFVSHVVEPPVRVNQLPHGYQLRILQGEEYGKTYNLTRIVNQGQKLLTVGRQLGNVIYIKSEYSDYISRHHCTLEQYSPDVWAVRDGQWQKELHQWNCSSNGTFVNSIPVSTNGYYLKNGDIIFMGDVTVRFENY